MTTVRKHIKSKHHCNAPITCATSMLSVTSFTYFEAQLKDAAAAVTKLPKCSTANLVFGYINTVASHSPSSLTA